MARKPAARASDKKPIERIGDAKALLTLRDAMIETSPLRDAMDQLAGRVSPRTHPAFLVEAMFARRTSEKHFASVREASERGLNDSLAKAGRSRFKGLSWKAPPGKPRTLVELTSLEALEETLCEIHHAIRDAAVALSRNAPMRVDPAAFLQNVFPHTLCRHAVYRNMVCELQRLPPDRYRELLSLLPDADLEQDAGMIRMIAAWSEEKAPEPFHALLARFLDHRLVKSDMVLLERVVSRLARAPKQEYQSLLHALKKHVAESVPRETPNRFAAGQAVDELLLALGDDDVVEAFLKKLAGKGFVSTEEKMTALSLAATGKAALAQDVFERLFSEQIESEHLVYTSWTAAITGNQVRDYILKILRDAHAPAAKVISVAKYCFWARRDGVPALALVPLLERIGPAVKAARNSPGESWEDRNWGGYNTSDAEDLADALSSAVKALTGSDCNATGWADLIAELARGTTADLTKVPLGDSSTCGFSFRTINLLARLKSKIARLNEPALTKAFEKLGTKSPGS